MSDPTELDLLRRLVAAEHLVDDVTKFFPLVAQERGPLAEDARVARTAHELAQEELSQARYEFVHLMRLGRRPLSAWKDASSLALDLLESRAEAQEALDSMAETEQRALRAPYRGDELFSKRRPF